MFELLESLPRWAFYLTGVLIALGIVALAGWGMAKGFRKYIRSQPKD